MGYDVDAYIIKAGGWSTFQKQYTWLYLSYPWTVCGMQTLLIIFVTMAPKAHRLCKPGLNCIPDPVEFSCDQEIEADYVLSSTIAEWDLRCENTLWGPMLGSIFFFGFLFGVVFLGRMCDTYGRRKTFFASLSVVSFFSLWGPLFAHSFFWYSVSRSIVGFAVGGIGLSAYVLNTEILPSEKRSLVLLTSNSYFAAGLVIVTLLALVCPSWRTLSVVVGLLGFPMFAYAWLPLVESPKWYVTQPNGAALAHEVICQIARVNGVPEPFFEETKLAALGQDEESRTVVETGNPYWLLLTHVKLRGRTWQMIGAWFACSMGYFGLSMEFPSYALALKTVSIPRIGRRGTVGISLFLAGVACVLCAVLPRGMVLPLALVGKFFMSAAFAVLYLFGAELFPTTLRSTALGVESLSARIAGILAPLIPALDTAYHGLPFIIFGLPAMLSGIGVLKGLPETLNRPMPMTIDDIDGARQSDFIFLRNGSVSSKDHARSQRTSSVDTDLPADPDSANAPSSQHGRSMVSFLNDSDLSFLDADPEVQSTV
eukprot:GEMP01021001.1.p1 GENE.GEMP01021001.1~~GEMP01021001.1.p1  ORF type:complete len:540 (+),score=57.02 GEMP01021001.1:103-1722(+)